MLLLRSSTAPKSGGGSWILLEPAVTITVGRQNGANLTEQLQNFLAYDPGFLGGVFVG